MINEKTGRHSILIVGAGVTGCVVGHYLAKQGYKVIIVEKESQIGGLARTFRYGDFAFDIGPHRFLTKKQDILSYIYNVLKDRYAFVLRRSGIYFLGKYYSWPLRPMSLFKLPLLFRLNSLLDLIQIASPQHVFKEDDFEKYILSNYGPTLYGIFFKEYTAKFLKLPPERIHADWAKDSIHRAVINSRGGQDNIFDVLKSVFRFAPEKMKFIYPEKGIDVFCSNLADEIVGRYGGQIVTNTEISQIKHTNGIIDEVVFGERIVAPSRVVWTGKITDACNLLELKNTGLEYLSLILYNIEVESPLRLEYQWCYYGNHEIFSRVSTPQSFSKYMSPPGKYGLCVEVTCRENDHYWHKPEVHIRRVISDLQRVGLLKSRAEIEGIHIEKIANAYPIYTLEYRQKVQKVLDSLGRFKNLIPAGRSGLFWYNNMDDSIENGIAVAKQITQELKQEMIHSC